MRKPDPIKLAIAKMAFGPFRSYAPIPGIDEDTQLNYSIVPPDERQAMYLQIKVHEPGGYPRYFKVQVSEVLG